MIEQIGIIIMNYDEKILVCKDGYFIRATVGEEGDVEEIIKREIRYYLDIDMFRIVKKFDEILTDIDGIRTMYLVEVGIFHKGFEFVNAEKMVKDIVNSNYKGYLERNLIRYDNNNGLATNILDLSVMFIAIDIIPRFIIKTDKMPFLPLLGVIGILYFTAHSFIKPKLINKLINVKLNTTVTITILNILMTLYWLRLFIIVR